MPRKKTASKKQPPANRRDKRPAYEEIKVEQLIEIIAERTKVHIGDVSLVFDEMRKQAIEAVTHDKKIHFGFGNLKLREYGWKEFNTGLLFTPQKKFIHEIRSIIEPNYTDNEQEINE